ncbi:MAG TPA: hypothetical protein VKQ27_13655 [Acetobacteraceae bacterium]|nr:hypothetical protein [Acetobacteraceae bacterium]
MDDDVIVEQGPPASVLDEQTQNRTRRLLRVVDKVEDEAVWQSAGEVCLRG